MQRLTGCLVAAGLAIGLAACSSINGHTAARSTAPPTATAITIRLQAAGLPIPKGVSIYTASTDPNNLLGRPGEYTSKTEWDDLRYPLADDASVGVEVFPTSQEATKRAAYIQSLMGGLLGTEYDYLAGPVLLRVSGHLTPAQAQAYGRAIGATLYTSS